MSTLQQIYGTLDGPPLPPVFIETPEDGGTVVFYPFDCTVTGSSMKVRYGTINGLAPSNINSTFIISTSGTYYVLLSVTTSNAQVVSSSISVSASPASVMPVNLGQPPSTFDIPIALLNNGKPFRAIGPGSLVATPYEVYRLVKSMTSPDSLPYDSYYSWRLGLT